MIYALFVERYIEIPLIDFCETLPNRSQAHNVLVVSSISKENADKGCNSFTTKTIVMSLSHDIYSDRPQNNIIIKFSLCVTHLLQWLYNKDKFV